jgi:hypothetical protein
MRPPNALQMRAAGFIGAISGEESGKLHVYALCSGMRYVNRNQV